MTIMLAAGHHRGLQDEHQHGLNGRDGLSLLKSKEKHQHGPIFSPKTCDVMMGASTAECNGQVLHHVSQPRNSVHYPTSLQRTSYYFDDPSFKQAKSMSMDPESFYFDADFSGFYTENANPAISPWSKYVSKETPLIIFGENDFVPASSSLTDSDDDASTADNSATQTKGTDAEASETRDDADDKSNTRVTNPYAQLCYDPERDAVITIVEVKVQSGNGMEKTKRLRVLDPRDPNPPASNGTDKNSPPVFERANHHQSQVTAHASEGDDESVFHLGVGWLEETELANLDLYLLHEFGENGESRKKCTDALKKLIIASRSLVVFSRSPNWETTYREPPQDFHYSSLSDNYY
jgi:hypothetical protein